MNFISGQAFITMMDSLFNEDEWNRHVLYITANSAAIHLQKRSTTILSQPMEYQISFLVHLPTLEKRRINRRRINFSLIQWLPSIVCALV